MAGKTPGGDHFSSDRRGADFPRGPLDYATIGSPKSVCKICCEPQTAMPFASIFFFQKYIFGFYSIVNLCKHGNKYTKL